MIHSRHYITSTASSLISATSSGRGCAEPEISELLKLNSNISETGTIFAQQICIYSTYIPEQVDFQRQQRESTIPAMATLDKRQENNQYISCRGVFSHNSDYLWRNRSFPSKAKLSQLHKFLDLKA